MGDKKNFAILGIFSILVLGTSGIFQNAEAYFDTPLALDSTGDVGRHTSIAIGNDGFPVISYSDNSNTNLKFVHCTAADCSSFDTPLALDSTGDVGRYTSIAIGNDGFPVISYYDNFNANLKFVHCTAADCDDSVEPDTTIDSKVDGYNIDLSDMTTVSDGATFEFSGDDGAGSGVASFECNINSAGWVACTSPQAYSGLSLGANTFGVRAIDNAGNTDSTPASFSWMILTPGEATDELISDIEGEGLANNVKNSLLGSLKKTSKILNDTNLDNDQAACDKLTEFINNVNDKEASGKLGSDSADELEADAQAIKDAIGCPLV